MVGQPGFFEMSDCLRGLSAKGDDLARIAALVAFAPFRTTNEKSRPLWGRLTRPHLPLPRPGGADVFDYIERFQNPGRRHSTIAYLSPMNFMALAEAG